MEGSPINPSDLIFLEGRYPLNRKLPCTPGIEGSGIVVGSGGGFRGWMLKGKRVACVGPVDGDGTWAEYMVTDVN